MDATLAPDRMVHGGRALARTEDGSVALVTGAIPGETVRVRLRRVSGVLQGETTEVLAADPDRVPTPEHPGLDLGFVRYERQLALKAEVLRDAAHRAGVTLPEPEPRVRPSPREWGYRCGIQPAVREGRLGYRAPGSDRVVFMNGGDPTAMPALQEAWALLEGARLPNGVVEVALRGNDAGEALAAFVTTVPDRELLDFAHRLVAAGLAGVAVAPWNEAGRFRSGKSRLAGKRAIRQRFGEVEASVSATAFAQPNPEAAGEAFRTLLAMTSGGGHAVELFAGSGVIGMHLARRYAQVTAVEGSFESVARGRADAERLGTTNLTFVRADARRVALPEADLIVVDPPRAGLAKALRQKISETDTKTLAYMACDVATWARDAHDLQERGWRLAEVAAFDFQPHTHHLELVTRFER